MKDVDSRVFTRMLQKDGRTDGSVTISLRNFIGEGIINFHLRNLVKKKGGMGFEAIFWHFPHDFIFHSREKKESFNHGSLCVYIFGILYCLEVIGVLAEMANFCY